MSASLPSQPDFRQLKNQAKGLLKAHRAADPEAARRLRQALPELAEQLDAEILQSPLALKDAQRAVAREYGFDQWADLKQHIASRPAEPLARPSSSKLKRQFERHLEEALALLRACRQGERQASQRVGQALQASEHVRTRLRMERDAEPRIQAFEHAMQVIAHEHGKPSWEALYFDAANPRARFLPPDHPFIVAIRELNLVDVRRFLEADPSLANARVPRYEPADGKTWKPDADDPIDVGEDDPRNAAPLHFAAHRGPGRTDLARLLIEFGADVNSLGFYGGEVVAPIVLAAWEGDRATVQVLLEAGADPDLGQDALYVALEHGGQDRAQLLLQYGATHNIFTAAMYGDVDAVRALVEAQPGLVHERSPWGNRTALAEALHLGQMAIVELLVDLGADLTPESAAALGCLADIQSLLDADPQAIHAQYNQLSLLSWAVIGGQLATIDFLLKRGANPNQGDDWGCILRRASTPEVVDHLVGGGADVHFEPTRGQIPFVALIGHGHLASAKALLGHGVNPNQRCNTHGRTAYHWVLMGHTDVEERLSFLLENGADPSIPDDSGQTPLEWALERGDEEAVRILREVAGILPQKKSTFSAAADFSLTSNANTDTWSYRYKVDNIRDGNYPLIEDFAAGLLLTCAGEPMHASPGPDPQAWQVSGQTPWVAVNTSGVDQSLQDWERTIVWPKDAILVHPPENGLVVVSWLSPSDGLANVDFAFADMNPAGGGNGIAWYVELNDSNETLGSGIIERGGSPTGNLSFTDIKIAVGQRLNFIVNANGDHRCDWTYFEGSVILNTA